MPTTTKPKTIQQRAAEATRRLRTSLDVDDLKLLSAAVAEAAAEEVEGNARFSARVHAIYQELAALQASRPTRRRSNDADDVELIPLPGTEGIRIDAFGGLDPYMLLRLYGSHQLRAALSRFSYSALREAAETVKTKRPGTKPKDGRKAESVLDYIVEQIAPGN